MVVLKRLLVVQKPADQVEKILRSCAYYAPQPIFGDGKFSMYCLKHNNRGKSLFHISGSVSECENHTEVIVNVHADHSWYLGCIIGILGLFRMIYGLILSIDAIPYLAFILLGSLYGGTTYARGVEILDVIEHKITRKTGDCSVDK